MNVIYVTIKVYHEKYGTTSIKTNVVFSCFVLFGSCSLLFVRYSFVLKEVQ